MSKLTKGRFLVSRLENKGTSIISSTDVRSIRHECIDGVESNTFGNCFFVQDVDLNYYTTLYLYDKDFNTLFEPFDGSVKVDDVYCSRRTPVEVEAMPLRHRKDFMVKLRKITFLNLTLKEYMRESMLMNSHISFETKQYYFELDNVSNSEGFISGIDFKFIAKICNEPNVIVGLYQQKGTKGYIAINDYVSIMENMNILLNIGINSNGISVSGFPFVYTKVIKNDYLLLSLENSYRDVDAFTHEQAKDFKKIVTRNLFSGKVVV